MISSHVKITCYLHVWRYEVFAGKLTWYFTGVYIINSNIMRGLQPVSTQVAQARYMRSSIFCWSLYCHVIWVICLLQDFFYGERNRVENCKKLLTWSPVVAGGVLCGFLADLLRFHRVKKFHRLLSFSTFYQVAYLNLKRTEGGISQLTGFTLEDISLLQSWTGRECVAQGE